MLQVNVIECDDYLPARVVVVHLRSKAERAPAPSMRAAALDRMRIGASQRPTR